MRIIFIFYKELGKQIVKLLVDNLWYISPLRPDLLTSATTRIYFYDFCRVSQNLSAGLLPSKLNLASHESAHQHNLATNIGKGY